MKRFNRDSLLLLTAAAALGLGLKQMGLERWPRKEKRAKILPQQLSLHIYYCVRACVCVEGFAAFSRKNCEWRCRHAPCWRVGFPILVRNRRTDWMGRVELS